MNIQSLPDINTSTSPPSADDGRSPVRPTAFFVALSLNLGIALVCFLVLGNPLGWLSAGRLDFPQVIGYGLPFLQFALLGYLLDKGFIFFVRRLTEIRALDRHPPRLGLQLVRLFIYFCVLAMAVSWDFNQSITGILAASGVIGLVLGFALRGMVSDLFFGIALHLDRNLSVGDWIDFSFRGKDHSGQLKDIHWRSVVLEDLHSNVMLVPNSEFASAVIVNRSKPGFTTEFTTYITLGNECECGRVLSVLDMVMSHLIAEVIILSHPPPSVRIASIEGGVIKYRLAYSVTPGKTAHLDAQSLVLRTAVQFLRAAGFYLYPLYPNYMNPDKLPADRPQNRDVRLRVLASVPLLRVLSPEALDAIATGAEARIIAAGELLIQAGEPGETMWVIAEGAFDVIVHKDGEDTVVTSLWPGDWVGEMSLLTGEPRSATIRARTGSYVYAIKKRVMEQLFDEDPELVNVLAQIAGRRRKKRDTQLMAGSDPQDRHKTNSTIARIRLFFGMPPPN